MKLARFIAVERIVGALFVAVVFSLLCLQFVQRQREPQRLLVQSTLSVSNNSSTGNGLERHTTPGQRDFHWYIDRPKEAPLFGWEDTWMVAWKKKKYRQSHQALCPVVGVTRSPVDDGVLCDVPPYIPPRAIPRDAQKIPRIIFQSHMYRQVSMSQYVHFASWIALNPTYEYILFDDDDVDDFLCENFPPDIYLPYSKLVAGASRIDVWRVLIMSTYGGVYLDSDLLALNPLPIQAADDVVTGLGCWGLIPGIPIGVFEHWSMAFSPRHRLASETLKFILLHLNNASWKEDVIQTTGPGPYQLALHSLLAQAKCKQDFCDFAKKPNFWNKHCDPELFTSIFGNLALFPDLNFNQTYANKLFKTAEYSENTFNLAHYDELPLGNQDPDFCELNTRKQRKLENIKRWKGGLANQQRRELRRDQGKPPLHRE